MTHETRWELPNEVRFQCPPELEKQFDAEEFQKLKEQFRAADSDGSGALDKKEVQQVMEAAGGEVSGRRLNQLFQVCSVLWLLFEP